MFTPLLTFANVLLPLPMQESPRRKRIVLTLPVSRLVVDAMLVVAILLGLPHRGLAEGLHPIVRQGHFFPTIRWGPFPTKKIYSPYVKGYIPICQRHKFLYVGAPAHCDGYACNNRMSALTTAFLSGSALLPAAAAFLPRVTV